MSLKMTTTPKIAGTPAFRREQRPFALDKRAARGLLPVPLRVRRPIHGLLRLLHAVTSATVRFDGFLKWTPSVPSSGKSNRARAAGLRSEMCPVDSIISTPNPLIAMSLATVPFLRSVAIDLRVGNDRRHWRAITDKSRKSSGERRVAAFVEN
jgi:hypothetical protein